MKLKLASILSSLFATICLLIVLEIVASALLPSIGMENYRIHFNILIILFLAFKLETPYLPLIIMVVQLFHGAFSVEGWALGTFTGVIISIIISYLKELIDLKSSVLIILMSEIFQVVWIIITMVVFYVKFGSVENMGLKLSHFVIESLLISFLAPFFFSILDKIWKIGGNQSIGMEV